MFDALILNCTADAVSLNAMMNPQCAAQSHDECIFLFDECVAPSSRDKLSVDAVSVAIAMNALAQCHSRRHFEEQMLCGADAHIVCTLLCHSGEAELGLCCALHSVHRARVRRSQDHSICVSAEASRKRNLRR